MRGHFRLEFMYRHDSHVLDPAHALPAGLAATSRAVGLAGEISAMTASCDSWLYNNTLGIPTVVFGPGTLGVAHSRDEHIRMEDIERAAVTLLAFAANWCGRS
jgi:acetylornithine deacetylase/succinyl-diaminopimelate desuccinylase-like protein